MTALIVLLMIVAAAFALGYLFGDIGVLIVCVLVALTCIVLCATFDKPDKPAPWEASDG